MKIKKIISQHRRDFTAIYECESCGFEKKMGGYDDSYFHNEVIPNFKCDECGSKGSDDYEPLAPKYADGVQI